MLKLVYHKQVNWNFGFIASTVSELVHSTKLVEVDVMSWGNSSRTMEKFIRFSESLNKQSWLHRQHEAVGFAQETNVQMHHFQKPSVQIIKLQWFSKHPGCALKLFFGDTSLDAWIILDTRIESSVYHHSSVYFQNVHQQKPSPGTFYPFNGLGLCDSMKRLNIGGLHSPRFPKAFASEMKEGWE